MDQSGDVSGGAGPTGVTDPSSFSFAPSTLSTFGASPSTIAMTGGPASSGGGSAVGAPGGSIAAAANNAENIQQIQSSPTGFDPAMNNAINNAQRIADAPIGVPSSATAGGTAAAGATPAGTNSVLNAIQNPGINSVLNAVGSNLGPLASLGVLGFEAANKPGGIGGSQLPAAALPGKTAGSLATQAGTLQTAGQTLSQPLATGVLPPGAQAAVDQVTKEQEAQIRQQFATMGLTGSTMETEALAQAKQNAQARGFQIAQSMAQQGLADMSLSSNIFSELLNTGLQSDQEFQSALTAFANSLAGGGGGTTIRVG